VGQMGKRPRLVADAGLQDLIVAAVQQGASFESVIAAFHIDKSTFYRWLRRGRAALAATIGDEPDGYNFDAIDVIDRPYADFARAVDAARGRAELDLLNIVIEAAKGGQVLEESTTTHRDGRVEERRRIAGPDGRVALAVLERRFAPHWGRTVQRVELTGADGGPVVVQEARLDAAMSEFLAGVQTGQQMAKEERDRNGS
jgi:hypothetical protein